MAGIDGLFEAGNLPLLKRALSAYALRHRAVADNIANVATEGYRAQKVEFESVLQEQEAAPVPAMRTHPAHMPSGGGRSEEPRITDLGEFFDNGINDVNVEREEMALAQNQLMYRMATRLLTQKYQGLRAAITGRTQ